jgi:hypothetical protein
MKIALCFIINYEHILNKEELWKKWIQPNIDIINVYFYYKDIKLIKSSWILKHAIPEKYIYETNYYHVVPAYLSLMRYAYKHDDNNLWFCMLTESCCPIISPDKFRYMFYNYYDKSIINCKPAWWNINLHKRANLAMLPKELRLGNDPWFVIKREDVNRSIRFVNKNKNITNTICSGGLANESLFAIIMHMTKQYEHIIKAATHATDWSRMASATSPHLFKNADDILDIKFIDNILSTEKYVMFIRKISPNFPDEILEYYIYNSEQGAYCKMNMPPIYFVYLKIYLKIKKLIIFMLFPIFPLFPIFIIFSIFYFFNISSDYHMLNN